jgi:hypothetical protein
MVCCAILESITFSREAVIGFWFFSIPAFAVAVIISYFEIKKSESKGITITPEIEQTFTLYKQIGFLVILIYISGAAARIEALRRLSDVSAYEVTLVMEDKTLITDKNFRFIGKTKNYIFFYNISKKQSEVYAISEVKNTLIRDGFDYSPKEDREPKQITISFEKPYNWLKTLFKRKR